MTNVIEMPKRDAAKKPFDLDAFGVVVAGLGVDEGGAGIELVDIAVHRPTLDDVFLSLTGEHVEDTPVESSDRRGRSRT